MSRPVCALLGLALLATGCAYHEELRNLQLIYAGSIDLNDKNEILAAVTIQSPGSQERMTPSNEVITATGKTLEEALFKKIALQIAGPIGISKNQIILIGEKLARKDMAQTLDASFRNSSDPLLSKVAIVPEPQQASELIRMNRIGTATVGEYLRKILKSAVYESDVPYVTLHSLMPIMFDPGRDCAIPLIRKAGNKAEVSGIALFNERRYTGYSLSKELSTLFILLNGQKGGICIMTRELIENGESPQPISINVIRAKRKMTATIGPDGRARATIRLRLKAAIVELPQGNTSDKKAMADIGRRLSDILTEQAKQITDQLKEANSDAFGVGRELMAFHRKQWNNMDWNEEYPKMEFDAKVEVSIDSHGIKY